MLNMKFMKNVGLFFNLYGKYYFLSHSSTAQAEKGNRITLHKQSDNKFHLISYFSQATTAAEKNYHSFKLEAPKMLYSLNTSKGLT